MSTFFPFGLTLNKHGYKIMGVGSGWTGNDWTLTHQSLPTSDAAHISTYRIFQFGSKVEPQDGPDQLQ